MGRWVISMPDREWDALIAALPKPTPDAFATADIGWLRSKGRRTSQVALMDRWGWGRHRVRTFLESIASVAPLEDQKVIAFQRKFGRRA